MRDVPAEAVITSHKLLLRGGFIRRVSPGVYAYLPLLWKVIQKISAIVREEMNFVGGLETLLPQLQPSTLWQRSGRWAAYTAGEGIMFHLKDRQDREFGLGPTHEEIATQLAADLVKSYRQLPFCFYQIQTKFRDEIRPRFGLMRSREFIMKDAYSFHSDSSCLEKTYASMDNAYRRIFSRCGLQTIAVEADSGAIGGSASQEFMVTAANGEDLILTSRDSLYSANQERAISLPADPVPLLVDDCKELHTPNQTSIEDLCAAHGFDPTQTVKVLLLVARFSAGKPQPVLISLRGDQQLNEVKLANAITARSSGNGTLLDVLPIGPQDLLEEGLPPLPFGYLGPHLNDTALAGAALWQERFLRLADPTAAALDRFICGSNRADHHLVGTRWAELCQPLESVNLRTAQPGDRCLHDPSQVLEAARGIEVGHIFQLGRKYSLALEARFTNAKGDQEDLWMGCYGIGVSRLAQAAVEQNHDHNGILWPVSIAPYEVIIVMANLQDSTQVTLAESLYNQLLEEGVDVLLDDRAERAGVKFKDADLIGIPWRLVVGRGAPQGTVELVCRNGGVAREMVAAEAVSTLVETISQARKG